MDNKHLDFNAELLFKRKDKHCGYRFCPLCGEALKEEKIDNHQRMICTREACDFIYYQNPIPAAGAIIVENNKILLVKRAHPPKIGWWCLPAGFMEWKEHPAQTAVREVAEETGLNIKITSFFDVYSSTDDPRSNSILLLYLCEIIGGKLEASDDALEVCFFDFDNLPKNIAFKSHFQAFNDYHNRYHK